MDASEIALQRAHQLAELGRWQEALSLSAAAAGTPTTALEAHLLRARCLLATERSAEAITAAAAALAEDPSNADALLLQGAAQLNLQQTRKALRSAKSAAQLDPWSVGPQYLMVLCWLTFGVGYRGKARAAAAKALELDPQSALAHEAAGLAAAHAGRGHRAEAERHYRAGLAIDPQSQELSLHLGDLLRKSGRHPEAAASYLAASAVDPTDDRARLRLARLGVPGIAGLGIFGKYLLLNTGGRLAFDGHALGVAVWGTAALVLGAAVTTGLTVRRNASLPASVRAGLHGDYRNSCLAWARAAGVLQLVLAAAVALDPTTAGLPRGAAILLAGLGVCVVWASLHYRVGPRLTRTELRGWFRLRRH